MYRYIEDKLMDTPSISFKIGEKIKNKSGEIIYICDIVYSMVEKGWLVIYYELDKQDKIQKMNTMSLDLFSMGL